MEKKLTFSAKQITGIAVLLALVIVLQAVGGTVSIGAVQLNFTLIPIVLSGIIFGELVGAFTGLACGIVILIQVILGTVPFYTLIWTGDPVVVAFTCILKTTVAGYLGGLAYKLISPKNELVATFVSAAVVPVVNTLLFVIGCLFMTNSVYTLNGSQNILVYILVSIVTFNFFIELGVNMVVAPALNRVIKAIKF